MSARVAACVCSRGYVNESRGWICRRLASPVGCGVAIAAADPATLWDDPGSLPRDCCAPPLTPGNCEPPGDDCGPPLAPHRSLLAAASLLAASFLPPESTWVAHLQAATLQARPTTANHARSLSRCSRRPTRTRTLWPGPLGFR
jgi:hypothetical protein